MDNDSVSFLMAPPPTAAAQNDEAKEEDSATIEALRQTIVLREQQVKFSLSLIAATTQVTDLHCVILSYKVKAQISQLQFLQDSLSEQKAVNQNLKSQSVTLKTALEEVRTCIVFFFLLGLFFDRRSKCSVMILCHVNPRKGEGKAQQSFEPG